MDSVEACISELKALPLFSTYEKAEILNLCAGAKACYTKHHDIIIRAGEEAIYFGVVISGAYKLTKLDAKGEDVIVHFAVPGDVIAAFIMPQVNSRYPITATAIGPSRFLKIPRENFSRSWKSKSDLIFAIQSALALRMQQLQNDKTLIKAPLSQKLASLLFNLLEKSNQTEDGLIPMQLTRQELADNLGASVESIIRQMSDWSKKGILETSEKQIRILKVDQLIRNLNRD